MTDKKLVHDIWLEGVNFYSGPSDMRSIGFSDYTTMTPDPEILSMRELTHWKLIDAERWAEIVEWCYQASNYIAGHDIRHRDR